MSGDFGDGGCLSRHYRRRVAAVRDCEDRGCYSLDQPGNLIPRRRGARCGEKKIKNRSPDQWQGGGGRRRKWSELVTGGGGCHAAFLSQSRLDHFLGEKRHPALCKLWIDCDCPRYKGTRVQVMIVCFWQTPPSSGYVASCSTVWFFGANRCYGDRASWLPPLLFFFFFFGARCVGYILHFQGSGGSISYT